MEGELSDMPWSSHPHSLILELHLPIPGQEQTCTFPIAAIQSLHLAARATSNPLHHIPGNFEK